MPGIRTNLPLVLHNCWAGQQGNSVRILGMTPFFPDPFFFRGETTEVTVSFGGTVVRDARVFCFGRVTRETVRQRALVAFGAAIGG